MSKMNWDRVRKENQARRSGSEWISLDGSGYPPEPDPPSTRKEVIRKKPSPARMLGCACKKTVGFVGQHKKRCPLRKDNVSDTPAWNTPDPVLGKHSDGIKKQLSALGDFLSSLETHANAGHRSDESHKETIRRLIQVLQDELREA